MILKLSQIKGLAHSAIKITGSKSETNRLLILQALFPGFEIENLSNSDDGAVTIKALKSQEDIIDIHHAGTAMRFLTAYFSVQENREVVLTGSQRMQERPIKILVDALRSLGADITYEKNEGYPPLRIKGTRLTQSEVTLKANVSSQYISALMLIGASLENGLNIHLEGKITSVPYIEMTLKLMHEIGIEASFRGQNIQIKPSKDTSSVNEVTVESDWSSVSYFYSIIALLPAGQAAFQKRDTNNRLHISSYKSNSLQGDSILQELYKEFGVNTHFEGHQLVLSRDSEFELPEIVEFDLANAPDIAQTIVVTCLGLGVACKLKGLHTLKIKETDRLEALKTEITKLGGKITVSNDSLELEAQRSPLKENVAIATYHDHRMAMAFAPLAMRTSILIEDANVVSKSYPDFWKDLRQIGFKAEVIDF